jgi:hypothetical protein
MSNYSTRFELGLLSVCSDCDPATQWISPNDIGEME